MKVRALQLLANSFLPEDVRDYNMDFSDKGLNRMLFNVAQLHGGKALADINRRVSGLGLKASYLEGETMTLDDLLPVVDRKPFYEAMDREIAALDRKSPTYKRDRAAIYQKYNTAIDKATSEEALRRRNNIALSVLSGARGKKDQLKAMIATPGTYTDANGDTVPVFSRQSFAEGIRPVTYLAGAFGTRASVATIKRGTAKGGDLAKQFAQSAADMVVRKEDCGTHNGIPLDVTDGSLKGRILARDAGRYKEGTLITSQVLHDLEKSGVESVVARSPLTCSVENGLCAHCVGKYFNGGRFPKIGDHIGALASSTATEPIAQGALCLAEGTLVRMADKSVKAIQDIVAGDVVLGADTSANVFPVKVVRTYDQGVKDCYRYSVSLTYGHAFDRVAVTCTPDHKFLVNINGQRKVRSMGEIPEGHRLVWKSTVNLGLVHIAEGPVQPVGEMRSVHCYDIEVDHPDHLFVLANGIITSNSSKHSGGMTEAKREYSGLDTVIQFTQSPEKFKDQAAVSTVDGRVESIEDAPQGGKYITVAGERHYVPAGHDPEVEVGQTVEAGDFLSEGLGDAEDVVKYKGLGAGRLYYATRLHKMLKDSGTGSDKRLTEVLARAAIRHVRIKSDEGYGNYLPDDIVDYSTLQSVYRMPETTKPLSPGKAVGKYLQAPAMHYTIGTRITPTVARDLESHGYSGVLADDSEPEFEPEMVRLRGASHTTPDWLASQGTSYLTKQLEESVTRGDDTNVYSNPDWRPRLAYGKDFGKNLTETGEF